MKLSGLPQLHPRSRFHLTMLKCWYGVHCLPKTLSITTNRLRSVLCSPAASSWASAGGNLHARATFAASKKSAHIAATSTKEVPDGITDILKNPRVPRNLLPPSPEQQVAIDTLLHTKKNIIVDACAGSGKTTTILHLAQSAPEMKFLVLVYNRRLMLETNQRMEDLGLSNVTVHNYHTLGAQYYTSESATDQGLKRIVEDDMPIFQGMKLPDFSILVMDEQQDMTPILKRFVDKLLRDKGFINPDRKPKRGKHLRVVVLGDRRQEIYGFNNADSRFLTMAGRQEVFGYINKEDWIAADQTASNRITASNVDFINQQLLGITKPMRAVKSLDALGRRYPKPRYVICDPYEDLVDEVVRLLEMPGVAPTDIIVLSPSVRGQSAAIYLANDLALRGIPVFRSDSDVSDIAPEVAYGKVLICTYHQAKGIERKASIVLGFDQGYHTHYNKVSKAPLAVTNPQYVAATRALEHLILIHEHTSAPLPFVNLSTMHLTCDFVENRPLDILSPVAERSIPQFSVTALCRNVSETLITECLRRLDFRMIATSAYGSHPPPSEVTDRHGLLEGVANVTGTAITAIFEWRQRKKLSILEGPLKLLTPPKRPTRRRNPLRELPQVFYDKIQLIQDGHDAGIITTDDILYLSTLDMAAKDKDITKILNIPLDKYDWVSDGYSRDIQFVLNTLPDNAKIPGRGIYFESKRIRKFMETTHGGGPTRPQKKLGIILAGAVDICRPGASNKTVWEIKHSDSLQPEHLLQVALYLLLLKEPCSGFLISARTGQVVQILPKMTESLHEILQLLVDAKSGGEQTRLLNTYDDEEFLGECRRNFGGLVGKCALPAWFAMRPVGSRFAKGRKERGKKKDVDDDTIKLKAI